MKILLIIYLIGCVFAFITNTIHTRVFFKDKENENIEYPKYQKTIIYFWTYLILGIMSWIGFFFVLISLLIRLHNYRK